MGPRFHNLGVLARLLAAVCALALTFGDVARDLHLLVAAHVVCAAHGELVEASEGAQPTSVGRGPISLTAGTEATAAAHEHCWAQSAATRAPLLCATESTLEATRVAIGPLVATPLRGVTRGTDVLAYAPKQGPPIG